jgi:alkylation response protein AidB-like acyl-CoA dehydrogenase
VELVVTAEEREFREQARTWLEENKPREKRPFDGPGVRPFDAAWQRRQFDGGWAGINWPAEFGGRGLSTVEQLIWHEEYARAGAPTIGINFVGINHGGPTIIVRGSDKQKAEYLPKILRGEQIWCQGFSEPGAGSDLASLRTRAHIDGDELVVNGSKIWTSYAQMADRQELLVRTDPDAPKHKGITWVVCHMDLPGITIRPMTTIVGHQDFCEVFYDDVRIPLSNVVGDINDGWSVAMSTLSFERGTAFMRELVQLTETIQRLVLFAQTRPSAIGKGTAYDDDSIRLELGRLRAEVAALRALNLSVVSRSERTVQPGPHGSMVRLAFGLLMQRTHRLAIEILGPDVVDFTEDGPVEPWLLGWLEAFRTTISAGTMDIQRNIIGERVLGLPRSR